MSTAVLTDQSSKPAEPATLGGLAAQVAERRAKRDALQAQGISSPTRSSASPRLSSASAHW